MLNLRDCDTIAGVSMPSLEESLLWIEAVSSQFGRVVVGQRLLLRRLLLALLTGNHVLLEGVPGLGKTLTVVTIARCLDMSFQRIQFTPDMLPADIVGTLIYEAGKGEFKPHQGPIFANVVLADEVNRAPAKVQSALLEAMQERQVTIGNTTFPLPSPFFVLATQNPIEEEGTYRLPEAQLDRFLFKLVLDYPDLAEERTILDRLAVPSAPPIPEPVASVADIAASRAMLGYVHLDEALRDYILKLVNATRRPLEYGLKIQHFVRCGASPRASLFLALAAKGEAMLNGRMYVVPEDVKSIALDVLRHRLLLTYEADAEAITSVQILEQILAKVEVP